MVVTFLTGYNGIFNVTDKKNLTVSNNDDDFNQITISQGAYEVESLNSEIKRIMIEEGYFTGANVPFTIKSNCSTLGPIREISSNVTSSQNYFTPDDSERDLIGFKTKVIHEEYNLSEYLVDILSLDTVFPECDNAQGIISKSIRGDIIHNGTMTVNPGYECVEKIDGVIDWYMMNTKFFLSNNNFKLKNEKIELVSFNGQSISFRLSIKKLYIFLKD